MPHSLTPVPQDITNAVDDYIRSELRDCARYSNRAPLDGSGIWSLRRLVEQAYARDAVLALWAERPVLCFGTPRMAEPPGGWDHRLVWDKREPGTTTNPPPVTVYGATCEKMGA